MHYTDREYKSISGIKKGQENVQRAHSLAVITMIVQVQEFHLGL